MNYEQANAIKDLAPGVMKVLEGLGQKQCSKCKGKGFSFPCPYIERPVFNCEKCNGTGKVRGWKWQPKVGEWWLLEGNLQLIHNIGNVEEVESLMDGVLGDKFVAPILEWEVIEMVLEKAGYRIKFMRGLTYRFEYTVFINLNNRDILDRPFRDEGHTRQEAVMKAVLRLGEEMK